MSIRLRIIDQPNTLCAKCRWGQIVKFPGNSIHIKCAQLELKIERVVETCSEFTAKNEKTKYEMEHIAWVLETKAGKVIGFINPVEARKRSINTDSDDD